MIWTESSWEASRSLFISISFQKAYKSAFLVRFVVNLIYTSVLGEFFGCMVVVEMPGM